MAKIYISGKITGLDNFRSVFLSAENSLSKQGFTVINPCDLPEDHDKTWKSYMKEDLKALKECEYVFMLNNWTDSKGAKVEHWFAKRYGKTIIYQP